MCQLFFFLLGSGFISILIIAIYVFIFLLFQISSLYAVFYTLRCFLIFLVVIALGVSC